MSMTESGVKLATIENGLSPKLTKKFERLKTLAKKHQRASKPSPRKAKRPFYYNPADRD